jgi:hypothetical protein
VNETRGRDGIGRMGCCSMRYMDGLAPHVFAGQPGKDAYYSTETGERKSVPDIV